MRLAVLTTETPHHAHFVRAMAERRADLLVLSEAGATVPAYPTAHPFEAKRDEYEWAKWFARPTPLDTITETMTVDDINSKAALNRLRKFAPDAVVVFGTRRIRKHIITLCPNGIVNLHGGDPERYRGLDTHLWAVWHRDFHGLITTLHRLNATLDDGDIVIQSPVMLHRGMCLHELRAANTEVCVELTHAALDMFARDSRFTARPQRQRGRYYSSMPTALKEVCLSRFAAHTEHLA